MNTLILYTNVNKLAKIGINRIRLGTAIANAVVDHKRNYQVTFYLIKIFLYCYNTTREVMFINEFLYYACEPTKKFNRP